MGDTQSTNSDLYSRISTLISNAQKNIRQTANTAIVDTYWNIGRLIVEEEQKGEERAEYGKTILKDLSKRLTSEFGKGYTISNLKYMRQFYQLFSKRHSVSGQLSWTHYRHLLKVENEQARLWYMEEAVNENWSTRALERQINSFYYDRLLASSNKAPVIKEAQEKTGALTPQDVLKDPYVLIIDESHRSIYRKYQDIFTYFDGFLLGLTATPKSDIDHNTYTVFDIEDNVPTFAYELNEAIDEKYLVPYNTIETKMKFMEEGIHYDDLSDEEKGQWEETFDDGVSDFSGDALNKFLFNNHTVDTVLQNLMEKGIHVNGGDTIGKTILNDNPFNRHGNIVELFQGKKEAVKDIVKRIDKLNNRIAVSA